MQCLFTLKDVVVDVDVDIDVGGIEIPMTTHSGSLDNGFFFVKMGYPGHFQNLMLALSSNVANQVSMMFMFGEATYQSESNFFL